MPDADVVREGVVVETYAKFHGVELIEIPEKDGVMDKAIAKEMIEANDVAGLLVAQPNYHGIIEDFSGLSDICHAHKTLLVINTVASALGVLRTPKEWGADIACGDAQSLGIPMNYGGPYIGYLCTNMDLVRKMPGRLVGATTDAEGKRAFVLTMQAREQHIRREKATSNICTAQGFMCLFVASYLSLMGESGLKEVNEQSYAAAHYLQEELIKTGLFEDVYPGKPFLNEVTLRYTGKDLKSLRLAMAEKGYLLGIVEEGSEDKLIVAATELRSKSEIDNLVNELKNMKAL